MPKKLPRSPRPDYVPPVVEIPPDAELQKMSNVEFMGLWFMKLKHTTNQEWVRVAKEMRFRKLPVV